MPSSSSFFSSSSSRSSALPPPPPPLSPSSSDPDADPDSSSSSSTFETAQDLHLKLLMLGDTGVGKTCLLLRYCFDSFSPTFITTIGIDFKIKHISLDGQPVKLQIWDTAGQSRFRTIAVSYFKGSDAVMLVYDVADRNTFENVRLWVEQLRAHGQLGSVALALVGNKSDKVGGRAVTHDEGRELAESLGVKFFETSAKDNVNVEDAFMHIARGAKDRGGKSGGYKDGRRTEGGGEAEIGGEEGATTDKKRTIASWLECTCS